MQESVHKLKWVQTSGDEVRGSQQQRIDALEVGRLGEEEEEREQEEEEARGRREETDAAMRWG